MPRSRVSVRDNPVPGDRVDGEVVWDVEPDYVRTRKYGITRIRNRCNWRKYADDVSIEFVVPYHEGERIRVGGDTGVLAEFVRMYSIDDPLYADVRIGTALARVAIDDTSVFYAED